MAVGDIMLGERLAQALAEQPPAWLFENVQPLFLTADALVGNLECPLLDSQPSRKSQAVTPLRAPVGSSLAALRAGGFSALCLANNHILDFGQEGLNSTLDGLRMAGLKLFGAGRNLQEAQAPLRLDYKELKLSLLGFCPSYNASAETGGTAPYNVRSICSLVEEERKHANVVVVSLHCGVEYSDYPTPRFVREARRILKAGAQVILGHHPHVVQGVERHRESIIAYSLGNFAFDMGPAGPMAAYSSSLMAKKYGLAFSPNDNRINEAMILELELGSNGVTGHKIHPIVIADDFRPSLPSSCQLSALIERIETIGKNIGNLSIPMNRILRRIDRDHAFDYWKERLADLWPKSVLKTGGRQVSKLLDPSRRR